MLCSRHLLPKAIAKMDLKPRTYMLPQQPCPTCRSPIVTARSLSVEDFDGSSICDGGRGVPVTVDAVPMPAGSVGSPRDYIVAAWNVPPEHATFVVRWTDSADDADEPIYRRHNCIRSRARR